MRYTLELPMTSRQRLHYPLARFQLILQLMKETGLAPYGIEARPYVEAARR